MMKSKNQILVRPLLFSIITIGICFTKSSAVFADDIDSIKDAVLSKTCPGNLARMSLRNGDCNSLAARMAVSRGSDNGQAEREFDECWRKESEDNNLIAKYNAMISSCEKAERERTAAKKFDAANKAAINTDKNSTDIDQRLINARKKSQDFGMRQKIVAESLVKSFSAVKGEANQRREFPRYSGCQAISRRTGIVKRQIWNHLVSNQEELNADIARCESYSARVYD